MKKFWAKKVIKKMKGGGPLGLLPKGLQKLKDPFTKGVEKWGAKNLGIGTAEFKKEARGPGYQSDFDPTAESHMAGGGQLQKEFTEDVKLTHGGVALQDVLKKENDPKKANGGHIKKDREDLKSLVVKKAKGGNWIQGAVKKPGALRAVAAKEGLIKGDQKLSSSDLSKLGAQAKKSGNSLLAKRVSLAKTFAKMRKK